jgi:hypothetical protein
MIYDADSNLNEFDVPTQYSHLATVLIALQFYTVMLARSPPSSKNSTSC